VSTVGEVLRLGTYRRFLAGAICSGVGVWIFQTALYWAALQAGNTASVGILVAILSIPGLVLTLPAGYVTDRVGPFWLLFAGQAAPTAACIVGVAFVGSGGTVAFAPIALVTLVVGIAYALWNVPALVYVTRVVEPRLMGSAIGLMVLQYAIGRIVGGALGGILVSAGGAGLAFAVSAAIFALGCLVSLTLPRITGLDVRTGSTLNGMVEAIRWLRYAPATLALVVLGALSSLLSYSYIPLLGAISRDVIGAGAGGLGLLTSTSGIGMVISGLTVNALGIRLRRGRGVVVTMLLGAIAMAALGYSSILAVSVGLVIVVAFLSSSRSSLATYTMQSISPPRMRGRIAGLADFLAQMMSITGSLLVGALAATWGASAVLLGCAIAIVVIVTLVVVVWPRILSLDVDRDAHPMIGGRPYTEGRGAPPLLDPGPIQ
jgi:MFS family permease